MKIETICVGPLQTNCYIINDSESMEAIIIDPGSESGKIIKIIESKNLQMKCIINTHAHIDHTAEAKSLQDHFNIPFLIHQNELPSLKTLETNNGLFGIAVTGTPETKEFLQHNQEISFGNCKGKILFTPGHSAGGVSIVVQNHVFVGDSLFCDSIGRTDLPGGNFDQLISSIKSELYVLADETIVYPGHGPETTIGHEKQFNPFVSENAYL